MSELLPEYAPPPGGLAGLRRRIARRRQFNSALATVLAMAITAWLFIDLPRPPPLPFDVPLARIDRWEGPRVRARDGVVQQLPVSADSVRVYLVGRVSEGS